jgi:hypothetical protein
MDYGSLFTRAWDMIWKHKFLILLGTLAALGTTGSGGGNPFRLLFNDNDLQWRDLYAFHYAEPFQHLELPWLALGGALAVMAVVLVVGFLFWMAGTFAQGGLINGVNEIETGKPANFGSTFQAALEKGWRLIGIGLVPAIPGVMLFLVGMFAFALTGGFSALTRGEYPLLEVGSLLPMLGFSCLLIPLMLFLSLLSKFANRACMLEDLGVISSYRRGFKVLGDNLGPALLLFLLQVAISFGFALVMIVPGILIAMCCLLWPLLLLIGGAFKAYFSSLWTLAWNEWVRVEAGSQEPAPSNL